MIRAETKRTYLAALVALKCTDPETAHMAADAILCDLLSDLGYDDIVEAFKAVSKWYA